MIEFNRIDSAFLGLAPDRASIVTVSYLGLLTPVEVPPDPPGPPVQPPSSVGSREVMWSGDYPILPKWSDGDRRTAHAVEEDEDALVLLLFSMLRNSQ